MGIAFDYPEGATPLDPDESEGLIPRLTLQSELNEFEALNIMEATAWAGRSTRIKRALLDPEALRLLHRKMFDKTWKWAGTYRKTQKSIGCEAWKIPGELQMALDDLATWIQFGTYPCNEIAARFHHRLVWVHPFPNGNGRFARLATDLLCRQSNWPIPTWGQTNLANQDDFRAAYIQSLRSADGHDFARLVEFMYS